MKNFSVQRQLKAALEHACPALDLGAYPPHRSAVAPVRARARAWRLAWAGAALTLALMAGGWGWRNFSVRATLFLDVNPSVALSLNRADRVLSARALNEDAQALIRDMDLRGADAQVAVNALVGAMVQAGYLNGGANAVLISVQSADPEAAERLRAAAAASADGQLAQSRVEGALVSQVYASGPDLDDLSRTYQTTQGKAALIQSLIAQNPALTFDQLNDLSLSQLSLLLSSKSALPQGVQVSGQVSNEGYIGGQRAAQLALAHAGLDSRQATGLIWEMDLDDGLMIYEVEFYADDLEYEYKLDALTGDVVEWELEWKKAGR